MDDTWKAVLWGQFGAAIDMLENAITACPDDLWGDRSRQPEYWYLVYHTLFLLDCCSSESLESFAPPPPFTLSELDPAGVMPERVYRKDEMLRYLEYGRTRARAALAALTDERARRPCGFFWMVHLTVGDVMLQSMRHVQHHTAQLNLILRQSIDSAPRWVSKTGLALGRD